MVESEKDCFGVRAALPGDPILLVLEPQLLGSHILVAECMRLLFSHSARTQANQSGALRYHVTITHCFVGVPNIVPKLHTVPHLCIKKSPCHHQNGIPRDISDVCLLCQHEIKAASETKGGRNHSVPIHFKGCKHTSQVRSSTLYYWSLIRTGTNQRSLVYLSWKQ